MNTPTDRTPFFSRRLRVLMIFFFALLLILTAKAVWQRSFDLWQAAITLIVLYQSFRLWKAEILWLSPAGIVPPFAEQEIAWNSLAAARVFQPRSDVTVLRLHGRDGSMKDVRLALHDDPDAIVRAVHQHYPALQLPPPAGRAFEFQKGLERSHAWALLAALVLFLIQPGLLSFLLLASIPIALHLFPLALNGPATLRLDDDGLHLLPLWLAHGASEHMPWNKLRRVRQMRASDGTERLSCAYGNARVVEFPLARYGNPAHILAALRVFHPTPPEQFKQLVESAHPPQPGFGPALAAVYGLALALGALALYLYVKLPGWHIGKDWMLIWLGLPLGIALGQMLAAGWLRATRALHSRTSRRVSGTLLGCMLFFALFYANRHVTDHHASHVQQAFELIASGETHQRWRAAGPGILPTGSEVTVYKGLRTGYNASLRPGIYLLELHHGHFGDIAFVPDAFVNAGLE